MNYTVFTSVEHVVLLNHPAILSPKFSAFTMRSLFSSTFQWHFVKPCVFSGWGQGGRNKSMLLFHRITIYFSAYIKLWLTHQQEIFFVYYFFSPLKWSDFCQEEEHGREEYDFHFWFQYLNILENPQPNKTITNPKKKKPKQKTPKQNQTEATNTQPSLIIFLMHLFHSVKIHFCCSSVFL